MTKERLDELDVNLTDLENRVISERNEGQGQMGDCTTRKKGDCTSRDPEN